jgi:hypothetical protein
MVSTYYALQQLSLLLYQQMLYSTPLFGQWLVAHQLLECAIKNNFYQTNINQILDTQHQLQTLLRLTHSLFCSIFSTHIKFALLKCKAYTCVALIGQN